MTNARPYRHNTGKPPADEGELAAILGQAETLVRLAQQAPRPRGRRDFPAGRAGDLAFRAYCASIGTEIATPLPPPPPDPSDPHAPRELTLDEALAEMAAAARTRRLVMGGVR